MGAIIVSYDPFAMESRVTLFKNGKQEQVDVCSDIPELTNSLVNLAYANNIYSVRVRSPLAIYTEIERTLKELESTQYAENKIEVEIA